MKRLRSRLIAAFLGVAVIAMVPLAVISYYTLQIRNQKVRHQYLDNTLSEIEHFINYQSNVPTEVILPLAQYLQERISERQDLLDLLEYSQSLDDSAVREGLNWWEYQLWKRVLKNDVPGGSMLLQLNPQFLKQNLDSTRRFPQYPIQIIPKAPYQRMKEWSDYGLLYEEDNKVFCYKIQPIFKGEHRMEMEEVGALFCKILLIEKYPNEPNRSPDFYLRSKQYDPHPILLYPLPTIFEPYLSKEELARLFGFPPYEEYQEIDIEKVRIDADDYAWPHQYRMPTNPLEEEFPAFEPSKDQSTVPMQIKLFPIMNHRHELTAVMALGVPITSIIGTLGFIWIMGYGFSLVLIVIAAVLFARTIAKPIHELATAGHQMAEGDFSVRVQEKGTEEHRILSSTFNRLAERIQTQLVQLRHKTHELETSNRELSQTQDFLQNILANIRTGVMSIDRDGRVRLLNFVGAMILRVPDWKDRPFSEVIHCASLTNLIQYAFQQVVSVQENEVPYEWEDGTLMPLQVSIVPVKESDGLTGLVMTFHDLSAIRQLEEQVRRQDRLAALGRMAAGVAHEIRNPLGIIRGSAELLRNRFAGQPGEEGLSDFILDEVKRLSRVVNDFLLFSRPPVPNREEISLESLLEELSDYFCKQQIGDSYSLQTECVGTPSEISADMNLFRQVFLNLFLNAQEAMPEGGRIILRARVFSAHEVAIEVQDEGEGISPDVKDRIFDPFYTTKDTGTGLGLSLVHQIIASHGGRIELDSYPGKGSLFRLIFPSVESQANPMRGIHSQNSASVSHEN